MVHTLLCHIQIGVQADNRYLMLDQLDIQRISNTLYRAKYKRVMTDDDVALCHYCLFHCHGSYIQTDKRLANLPISIPNQ
jgi:hypothetical protein